LSHIVTPTAAAGIIRWKHLQGRRTATGGGPCVRQVLESGRMAAVVAPYRLRPMTITDIPKVSAIEHASFPTSWPRTAYQQELERNNLARYIVAVADHTSSPAPAPAPSGIAALLRRILRGTGRPQHSEDNTIVGFLGLWFMVDEAHIVTVAVQPDQRQRGVGELLVAEALELAREHGTAFVTLECRVSNTAAQALYLKYGFTRAGIRKRYYTDNGEDALIMTTPPFTDPAFQSQLEELRRQYTERYGKVMR
jgi:[ribosomal protein S18]-alanine N-acetyltransferase